MNAREASSICHCSEEIFAKLAADFRIANNAATGYSLEHIRRLMGNNTFLAARKRYLEQADPVAQARKAEKAAYEQARKADRKQQHDDYLRATIRQSGVHRASAEAWLKSKDAERASQQRQSEIEALRERLEKLEAQEARDMEAI